MTDPALTIHGSAAANFNERAEAILQRLTPFVPVAQPARGAFPTPHIAGHFRAKDFLSPPKISLVDAATFREIERVLACGGNPVVLSGEVHADFVRLAESIQKTPSLRNSVSVRFLMDAIARWLEMRWVGEQVPTLPEQILATSRESVRDIEIWIPIANLALQSGVEPRLGPVTFRSVTKEIIDDWERGFAERAPEHSSTIGQAFLQYRKALQGFAVAVVNCRAEPLRAEELAREEARTATALLRLLHGALLIPEAVCYVAPPGERPIGTWVSIIPPSLKESKDVRGVSHWHFEASDLVELQQIGIVDLADAIASSAVSKFDRALAASLILYSTAPLRDAFEEKLVYIFASLESMLVRDDNENLQQNVADRVAFLSKSPTDRSEFVRRYKQMYALRSGFVHHGRSVDEVAAGQQFLIDVWCFWMTLIKRRSEFGTKDDLINVAEDVKYGRQGTK